MIRVAINGFGRIGRLVLRSIWEKHQKDFCVCAINDLASLDVSAHLLKYDSVHRVFPHHVSVGSTEEGLPALEIGNKCISYSSFRDSKDLPWKKHNVDIVLECSGVYTAAEKAQEHINSGAKKVLISAPATGKVKTIVYGVNEDSLSKEDDIVSNASCTTNCLAPLIKVLYETVGIDKGHMTTIHSYTGDQRVVDAAHKDLRRARAAGVSMIPTSTGAARAVGLVIPSLQGKIDGTAIRVPTPNVSAVDFTFLALRKTDKRTLQNVFVEYAEGPLKGILSTESAPLVSSDFNGNIHSSIIDLEQINVVDETLCRVFAWYDNEWGFANRMLDVAKKLPVL